MHIKQKGMPAEQKAFWMLVTASAVVVGLIGWWLHAPLWALPIAWGIMILMLWATDGPKLVNQLKKQREAERCRRELSGLIPANEWWNAHFLRWIRRYPIKDYGVVSAYFAALFAHQDVIDGVVFGACPTDEEKKYWSEVERRYAAAGYQPLTLNAVCEAIQKNKLPEGLAKRCKGKVEYPFHRFLYYSWTLNPDLYPEQ